MKKKKWVLAMLLWVFSAISFAQEKSPLLEEGKSRTHDNPSSEADPSRERKFHLKVGIESLNVSSMTFGPEKISTPDSPHHTGMNIGLAYEIPLSAHVATFIIPNISYVFEEIALASGGKMMSEYSTLKVNQTLNYSFQIGSIFMQPYVGLGIGYGIFSDETSFGNRKDKESMMGILVEGNLGVQVIVGNWSPYIQFTTRRQDFSKYKERVNNTTTKGDIDSRSYNMQTIVVGTGYRF